MSDFPITEVKETQYKVVGIFGAQNLEHDICTFKNFSEAQDQLTEFRSRDNVIGLTRYNEIMIIKITTEKVGSSLDERAAFKAISK
jgi:hypothetical protein